MKNAIPVVIAMFLFTAPALAQGDLFVGYALTALDLGTTESAHGFAVAGSGSINDKFGIEGDFSYGKKGIFLLDITEMSFAAGPRFQSSAEGTRGYVHALVGASRLEVEIPLLPPASTTDFALLLGGGVDIAMGSRTAWRIGGDYVPVFGNGTTLNHFRIVTGVVFRFGE